MITPKKLNEIVARTGAEYGYEAVAVFENTGEWNVRWIREGRTRTIMFSFTDKWAAASEELTEKLVDDLFTKIFVDPFAEADPAIQAFVEKQKKLESQP